MGARGGAAAKAIEVDPAEAHLRALARRSADEDLAEHDLGLFIELTSPAYECPEHLRPLLDALDRSMREPVFALVEVPPRHAKTDTLLAGLVRRLRYRPTDAVAYCSYAAPLALRKSRRAREMAARAGVWTGDEVVRRNRFDPSQAVSYWQTIDAGSFTAGGRNSSFTGEGYQTVVYDDPLKNREEAESPIYQEKAIETWRMLAGRLEQDGSGFVSQQAWNDQDPVAILKAELGTVDGAAWEVITLPAVIDAVYDADERLIGGTPLWPARWTMKALARRKHDVGPYNWWSQYIPERKPRGDQLFGDPARYATATIDGAVIIVSCDPGIEDDKMKDSSGIVVAAAFRRPGPHHTRANPQMELHLDILLAVDQWRDWPDLLDYLEALQVSDYPGAPIILEEVSAFKALSAVAGRLNRKLRLYPVTPKGNKFLRAQPTGKAWNSGRIRVPAFAPWVAEFIKEAQRFTGKKGGKDNMIDATTQLYDYAETVLASLSLATSGGESEMHSSPF
jgi:hypothetical protein